MRDDTKRVLFIFIFLYTICLVLALKIKDVEQSNYLQNFTFRYLPNDIYKTISREIDLKQDIMTCTMKDFQDNKNT